MGRGPSERSLAPPFPLGKPFTAESAERAEHERYGSASSAISAVKSFWQPQNFTPALNPNVRGAPFSPMNPDGTSGPYANATGM